MASSSPRRSRRSTDRRPATASSIPNRKFRSSVARWDLRNQSPDHELDAGPHRGRTTRAGVLPLLAKRQSSWTNAIDSVKLSLSSERLSHQPDDLPGLAPAPAKLTEGDRRVQGSSGKKRPSAPAATT